MNWNATKKDLVLIDKIVDRFIKETTLRRKNIKLDYTMDINAAHSNGCRLDLQKLLAAPLGDFLHDVCGIAANINRETGKIENFFLPRCAE